MTERTDWKTNDDALRADAERLAGIAEQVLAGTPIEDFELGQWEIFIVRGYCEEVAFGEGTDG